MDAKDTRLTLRISSAIKVQLEQIAAKEGRSVAQITDAFIQAGLEAYRKNGPKSLLPWISRQKSQ